MIAATRGGAPGSRARKILEKADGTQTIVANKLDSLDVEAGDQLHFITWGGGGWGDPFKRDPELVRPSCCIRPAERCS